VAIERLDIITVKGLISNKVMKVNTSRLRLFRHPTKMGIEDWQQWIWMSSMWSNCQLCGIGIGSKEIEITDALARI